MSATITMFTIFGFPNYSALWQPLALRTDDEARHALRRRSHRASGDGTAGSF
jgi:hypothetical protein